jgi:uroporphyrinogen decarboxylase
MNRGDSTGTRSALIIVSTRDPSSSKSPNIAPYLAQLIRGYRDLGFYTIKHTDGNIMPILDQLVECNPHALHSLDPQGGVDMAEVKRRHGNRVCLIGNVNCGLLDTGTDAEVIESARYALAHGSPNGGYIFSTSNCVYPGMRLERTS